MAQLVTPSSARWVFVVDNTNTGVPFARASSHKRSTLPPGVARGTSREVAKSATRVLREGEGRGGRGAPAQGGREV